MLYIIGTIILFFFFYYILYKKFIYIDTVSAAIVMAIGVFSLNVAPQFATNSLLDRGIALFAIILWAFFMVSYLFSFIVKEFNTLHYQNVIGRFRIGTWVASTSVTVIIITKYFPVFGRVILPLVILNSLLWVFFFFISMKGIGAILVNKSIKNVNGILFLTTVSSQSLLLMYNNVWENFYRLLYINETLIAIGFLFYFVCITMLLSRYKKYDWRLVTDWKAPNCMVHGALSIIGSAAVISKSIGFGMLLLLWMIVLVIFVANEIVEVVRGVLRTKEFGFVDGLCIYHPSQWSRIFTFCMFYTFTFKFHTNYASQAAWIDHSQQAILIVGKWFIAMLLIIEIGLLVRAQLPTPNQFNTIYSNKLPKEAK